MATEGSSGSGCGSDGPSFASESGASRRSYCEVLRSGSPSGGGARSSSPAAVTSLARRAQPVRRIASIVVGRRETPEDRAGGAWQTPGRKKKRQRQPSEPLPSMNLREGLPPGLAGLCFKCLEPEHVVGKCTKKIKCLRCKTEGHIAKECHQRRSPPGRPFVRVPIQSRITAAPGPAEMGGVEAMGQTRQVAQEARGGDRAGAGSGSGLGRREGAGRPSSGPSHQSSGSRRDLDGHGSGDLSLAGRQQQEKRVAFEERKKPEICIIPRSREIVEAEEALRWSVVAYVAGARPRVPVSTAMETVARRLNLDVRSFSAHKYWPADFLFAFRRKEDRDAAMGAGMIYGDGFSIRCSPWNRQLQAVGRKMRYRVKLQLEGVPPNTWNITTARCLLGTNAWVERLDTATESYEDLSSFGVTAWTQSIAALPTEKLMWVEEPMAEDFWIADDIRLPRDQVIPSEVDLLEYPITFRLISSVDMEEPADYSAREEEWPSSDEERDGRRGRGSAGGGDQRASQRLCLPTSQAQNRGRSRSGDGRQYQGQQRDAGLAASTGEVPISGHKARAWDPMEDCELVRSSEGSIRWDPMLEEIAADNCSATSGSARGCTQGSPSIQSERPSGAGADHTHLATPEVAGAVGLDDGGHAHLAMQEVAGEEKMDSGGHDHRAVTGMVGAEELISGGGQADEGGSPRSGTGQSWSASASGQVFRAPSTEVTGMEMFTVELTPERGASEQDEATGTPSTPAPELEATKEAGDAIASFRERFRQPITHVLPRPAARKPRTKRPAPSVVKRSSRIAKFASGSSIKRQQRALITRLQIAREGEVIGEEALQAYLALFKEPLGDDKIAAILTLFGWAPETIPEQELGLVEVEVEA